MSDELPYCDVIMKGGITSGVVYPEALVRLSSRYRFKSLGGASAGAIGAAFGAAAEHNRAGGGFATLRATTGDLTRGRLARLFQPQPSTRHLLPVLTAAAGFSSLGKKRTRGAVPAVIVAIFWEYRTSTAIGVSVGGLLGAAGGLGLGLGGALFGALLGALVLSILIVRAVVSDFTIAVPANSFGICTGISEGSTPGLTDWLADSLDHCAGRARTGAPLTFGHLWQGQAPTADPAALPPEARRRFSATAETDPSHRELDLRMITTCLSHGKPYELPFEGGNFFFDIDEWKTLFPERVIDALLDAPPARPTGGRDRDLHDLAARDKGMRRLPIASDLPVIVAVRMSLSFPLLISAVPLYEVDFAASRGKPVSFRKLWFTDGGLVNNFPLHLFDEALPSRRTFAINLDRFGEGRRRHDDEAENVEVSKNNTPRLPEYTAIKTHGLGAVTGFAERALSTARSWQDNSFLNVPGYRDRIAKVFQTPDEGGLNLFMNTRSVERLSRRGGAAADALINQFENPHYSHGRSGWDNHRWIRYRALIAAMKPFADSYALGREALDLAGDYPSYPVTSEEAGLMSNVDTALAALRDSYQARLGRKVTLGDAPKPLSRLRRTSGA
jgi:hypothetical protein